MANQLSSRQIRPPIYSLKQTKLRRRRVVRFAILYFIMFILFLVLIIGPIIVKKFIHFDLTIPLHLMQPTGQANNDTSNKATGSFLNKAAAGLADGGAAATSGGGDAAVVTSTAGGGGGSSAAAATTSGFSFGKMRRF